jgi:hypothetical protein
MPERCGRDGWVDARFRESRDPEGGLTYISGRAGRIAAIAEMPIVDVTTGALTTVGRCLGASA